MKSSTQNTDTKRSGVKGSGTKSSDIKNSGTRSSGSKKRKGKRRKKRLAAKIILTSALLLFFLGCIYLVMSFHYKKHFLPGTVINGMDCKGLTVEEVKEELQESISQYTLTIYTKEDTSEVITGDMLGLTYSDDKGVTWTVPKCIGIDGMPPHFMIHSSGALILSYSCRNWETMSERAVVSYDNGETWSEDYVLDERINRDKQHDMGYPATVELSDGSLLTLYYQALPDDWHTSILYTKWRLKSEN